MVENCTEPTNDSTELETYDQFVKWIDEAKNNFSLWYDRQTKSKLVLTAAAYICWLFFRREREREREREVY